MNNNKIIIEDSATKVVNDFFSKRASTLQEGFDKSILPVSSLNDNMKTNIANRINQLAYVQMFETAPDKAFEIPLVSFLPEKSELKKQASLSQDFYKVPRPLEKTATVTKEEKINLYVPHYKIEDLYEIHGIVKQAYKDRISTLTYVVAKSINDTEELTTELTKHASASDGPEYAYVLNKMNNDKKLDKILDNYNSIAEGSFAINENSNFYKTAMSYKKAIDVNNKITLDLIDLKTDIDYIDKIGNILDKDLSEVNKSEIYNYLHDLEGKINGK